MSNEMSLAEFQAQVWRSMTEAQLQSRVVAEAKGRGWLVYHTRYSLRSAAGYPDLHLVRGERSVFVELKRMVGRVTGAQEVWLEALRVAGHEVYVWRPSDEAEIARVLG